MKVKASLKNLRVSPRKVRLVTNLIKGMQVENALVQLEKALKGSSREVWKLLKSAIANAENNFNLNKADLIVSEIKVGEGPTLKRWLPRAHGRATTLLKRTSNIYLTLEDQLNSTEKKAVKVENTEKKVKESKGKVKKTEKKEQSKAESKKVEKKEEVKSKTKSAVKEEKSKLEKKK